MMSGGRHVMALVPARGGSKRLPGKNIRPLAGRPLIGWTLDFAKRHPEVDSVIVSTDSEEIAEAARACGVDVPWLRPASLATDTADSVSVAIHAIAEARKAGVSPDMLVLLQPTTPFRDPAMLSEALRLCEAADGAPVVAFGAARSHPGWCFAKDNGSHFVRMASGNDLSARSQDLVPAYVVTGALYVIGTQRFMAEKSFMGDNVLGVVSTDRRYDCDIDDSFDWLVAEAVAATLAVE